MENILARPLLAWCKAAGIGKSLAYQEARRGRLRTFKIGKKRMILEADGIEYLHARRGA